MIRVAIADDQALIRGGLRMILEAQEEFEVVAEAANGLEAVSIVGAHAPDVILMDIQMPGMDGLEATERITAAATRGSAGTGELSVSATRVLILTTFDRDDYVFAALRAGASGFLLKTAPPRRLVEAVRLVADGEALLAPTVTRRLIEEHLNRGRPGAAASPFPDVLTPREIEVVRLIATGLSNAEIASELVLAEATVKTHVNRILTKLALRDRVQVVVLAYESGLVEPGVDRDNSG